MMRRKDWEQRLVAAVEATPAFAWGAHDCCRFAARVVEAITGEDPARFHAGLGADAKEAQQLVHAGGGLQALVTAALGEPIEPARAWRGDVMLVDCIGHRQTVGICMGARVACQGADGVVYLPRHRAVAAWRV